MSRNKTPAPNERFGGRRGATRGTLYRHFESSVPVLTFAKPRPTAKPPGVVRKFGRHFTGFLKCISAFRIGLQENENKCNLTVYR